jgi:hypothetical protein
LLSRLILEGDPRGFSIALIVDRLFSASPSKPLEDGGRFNPLIVDVRALPLVAFSGWIVFSDAILPFPTSMVTGLYLDGCPIVLRSEGAIEGVYPFCGPPKPSPWTDDAYPFDGGLSMLIVRWLAAFCIDI